MMTHQTHHDGLSSEVRNSRTFYSVSCHFQKVIKALYSFYMFEIILLVYICHYVSK